MLTFSAGHQIHNIVSLAVVLPIQWHRFVGLGGFGHLGWSHIGANLASLLIAFMHTWNGSSFPGFGGKLCLDQLVPDQLVP